MKKKTRCWKGYAPVRGKKPYSKGSCRKVRGNPARQPDEAIARELYLFIENDEILLTRRYPQFILNLERKMKRGVYDRERAVKLFMYLADEASKRYSKQFGDGKTHTADVPTRMLLAKMLRDRFESERRAMGIPERAMPRKNPFRVGGYLRETPEEAGYRVVTRRGKELILQDKSNGQYEIWAKSPNFAGAGIHYKGTTYEFMSSRVKAPWSFDRQYVFPKVAQNPREIDPNLAYKKEYGWTFVNFLKKRLIPDLRESGMDATADDYQRGISLYMDKKGVLPITSSMNYLKYLRETLIPDLKASGSDSTAADFERMYKMVLYTIDRHPKSRGR